MTYNLLEEPWLSVLYRNSNSARLNLVEALQQSAKLQIAYPNPMDRFAVFRFLITVLYWCQEETGIHFEDGIPTEWFDFLSDQYSHFELYGDGKRFMQDRGLGRLRPVTDLFHEIPTGNNPWHFRHVRDYTAGVCSHCCINAILRTPVFVQSGTPGMKTGVNGIPPIYSYFIGKSLLETITLNWNMREPAGEPYWVTPQFYPPEATIPYLAGLSTPGRRFFLHDPVATQEACSICGQHRDSLVYRIFFEPAPEINNKSWRDPFVLYSAEKNTPQYADNILSSGKALSDRKYRKILSECYSQLEHQGPVSIELIGFSSEQMKYNDAWSLRLKLDWKESDIDPANIISQWDQAVKKTELALYRPSGVSKDRQQYLKKSLKNDLLPNVEHKLLEKISTLLLGDKPDWGEATGLYRPVLRIASRTMVPGVGAKITLERNRIAYSLPKVTQLREGDKKDAK